MAENFNFGYDLFDYPVTDIEKSPKFLVLGTVPCLIIIIFFFWGGGQYRWCIADWRLAPPVLV